MLLMATSFLPTFYPQCTKWQRANNSWFRAFGRDIVQERRTKLPARFCHRLRHDWTLLTFDIRAMHIHQLMSQTNEFHCLFNAI